LAVRIGALLALACASLAQPGLAQPHSDEIIPPAATNGLDLNDYDDGLVVNEPHDDDAYKDDGPETDIDAVDAAHAAYLKKNNLQLKRPEYDAPEEDFNPPKPPPRWLQAIFDFLGHLGPLFQFIFWAAIVIVAAGVLYFLFGEAIRVRFGKSSKGKMDEADDVLADLRPDAHGALSLLDEADGLAREGRFAEAVHLLLFRSIDDIQQRLEGGVPRSLTAREIGGLRNLPDRAKHALGPIIAIVEHSFFGGRDVDERGWKTARDSYEQFAFGEAWA
jgi:cbb3-type cytochrome oxidase subunit 3